MKPSERREGRRRTRSSAFAWSVQITCLAAALACDPGLIPLGRVVPWETATLASRGMDGEKLEDLKEALAARGTDAFLVAREGALVFEWYSLGHGTWRKEGTASLAKSLVGGMALLVALGDGRIGIDDAASTYIPGWQDDSLKAGITIRQLTAHASGLAHRHRDGRESGWSERFWSRTDPFRAAIRDAPVIHPPGQRFHYSGPAYAALSYAITASLGGAEQTDIEALLRERVMKPLGVPKSAWTIGYGRTFQLDGLDLHASWSGALYTPRAIARVGQLMLDKGRWGDVQLVDSAWVERMTAYAGTPLPGTEQGAAHPAPAICWWVNSNRAWPSAPVDAFAGVGAGGQVLLVIPSLDLLAVRTGDGLAAESWGPGLWAALRDELVAPLLESVRESAPSAGEARSLR